MESTPLVSIIVPVYNVEKYIDRCVESVVSQTFTDWELLLIDDGSPDKSGELCDVWSKHDSRIKVFHKKNGGVSSARNLGIDHAQGDWLCFIDSDDYVDKTYIEDFININNHSDLIIQGYDVIQNNSIQEKVCLDCGSKMTYIDVIIETEKKDVINSPCFKLFKRNIIVQNNIRYDSNTSYGEDHLFCLEYLKYIKNISCSSSMGYHYMMENSASLTHRYVPVVELCYYSVMARNKQIDLWNINGKNSKLLETYNCRLYSNFIKAIKNCFNSFDKKKDYNLIWNTFKPIITKNTYKGLKVYQRILFLTIRYFPRNLSFLFFRVICHEKNS